MTKGTNVGFAYLLQNTFLFAASTLASSLVSLLLLPFYTGILSPAEYGEAELLIVTVGLLMPILTISISEAVLRFTFLETASTQAVASIGGAVIVVGVLALLLARPLLTQLSSVLSVRFSYLVMMLAGQCVHLLFFKLSKGLELVRLCALDSIVGATTTVLGSVVLLSVAGWGLSGYLSSLILAQFMSAGFLILAGRLWRFFSFRALDRGLFNEMIRYSAPFVPSAIAWWATQGASRFILLHRVGVEAIGLFAVASKLASVVAMATSVFDQAWQISGVKEIGRSDYASFYSTVSRHYAALLGVVSSLLIGASPLVAQALFRGDFLVGWRLAPALLIGAYFAGLSGVLGTVFLAMRRTATLMISTVAGAGVGLGFAWSGVIWLGAQGAAIGTALGFAVVWVVRYLTVRRHLDLVIPWGPFLASSALLIVESIVLLSATSWRHVGVVACILLVWTINFREVLSVFRFVLRFARAGLRR